MNNMKSNPQNAMGDEKDDTVTVRTEILSQKKYNTILQAGTVDLSQDITGDKVTIYTDVGSRKDYDAILQARYKKESINDVDMRYDNGLIFFRPYKINGPYVFAIGIFKHKVKVYNQQYRVHPISQNPEDIEIYSKFFDSSKAQYHDGSALTYDEYFKLAKEAKEQGKRMYSVRESGCPILLSPSEYYKQERNYLLYIPEIRIQLNKEGKVLHSQQHLEFINYVAGLSSPEVKGKLGQIADNKISSEETKDVKGKLGQIADNKISSEETKDVEGKLGQIVDNKISSESYITTKKEDVKNETKDKKNQSDLNNTKSDITR